MSNELILGVSSFICGSLNTAAIFTLVDKDISLDLFLVDMMVVGLVLLVWWMIVYLSYSFYEKYPKEEKKQ